MPYEFQRRLTSDERPQMLGGGLGPYEPGEYSDDTQMAEEKFRLAIERVADRCFGGASAAAMTPARPAHRQPVHSRGNNRSALRVVTTRHSLSTVATCARTPAAGVQQ